MRLRIRLCKIFRNAVRAKRLRVPSRLHANVAAFKTEHPSPEDHRIEAKFYRLGDVRGLTALAVAMQDNAGIALKLQSRPDSDLKLIIELADMVPWHESLDVIMLKTQLPLKRNTASLSPETQTEEADLELHASPRTPMEISKLNVRRTSHMCLIRKTK